MSSLAYVITTEPRGALYHQLLTMGLEQCAKAGFIIQGWRTYPSTVEDLLERLSPYLIETRETAE